MKTWKWILALIILVSMSALLLAEENCGACKAASACPSSKTDAQMVAQKVTVNVLPGYNKKVEIDKNTYFIYSFAKKAKMGQNVMKIQVFSNGKTVTNYQVFASYDMPSMRGMHTVKDQAFQLNNKGVYMTPINLVMPGDWEIVLKFQQAGKVIYVGTHSLKI